MSRSGSDLQKVPKVPEVTDTSCATRGVAKALPEAGGYSLIIIIVPKDFEVQKSVSVFKPQPSATSAPDPIYCEYQSIRSGGKDKSRLRVPRTASHAL